MLFDYRSALTSDLLADPAVSMAIEFRALTDS
jgi:hypothetical protein